MSKAAAPVADVADPEFRSLVDAARRDWPALAAGALSATFVEVVEMLAMLMRSAESEAIQFAAARTLLAAYAETHLMRVMRRDAGQVLRGS